MVRFSNHAGKGLSVMYCGIFFEQFDYSSDKHSSTLAPWFDGAHHDMPFVISPLDFFKFYHSS
jgi:hypothetical protein